MQVATWCFLRRNLTPCRSWPMSSVLSRASASLAQTSSSSAALWNWWRSQASLRRWPIKDTQNRQCFSSTISYSKVYTLQWQTAHKLLLVLMLWYVAIQNKGTRANYWNITALAGDYYIICISNPFMSHKGRFTNHPIPYAHAGFLSHVL